MLRQAHLSLRPGKLRRPLSGVAFSFKHLERRLHASPASLAGGSDSLNEQVNQHRAEVNRLMSEYHKLADGAARDLERQTVSAKATQGQEPQAEVKQYKLETPAQKPSFNDVTNYVYDPVTGKMLPEKSIETSYGLPSNARDEEHDFSNLRTRDSYSGIRDEFFPFAERNSPVSESQSIEEAQKKRQDEHDKRVHAAQEAQREAEQKLAEAEKEVSSDFETAQIIENSENAVFQVESTQNQAAEKLAEAEDAIMSAAKPSFVKTEVFEPTVGAEAPGESQTERTAQALESHEAAAAKLAEWEKHVEGFPEPQEQNFTVNEKPSQQMKHPESVDPADQADARPEPLYSQHIAAAKLAQWESEIDESPQAYQPEAILKQGSEVPVTASTESSHQSLQAQQTAASKLAEWESELDESPQVYQPKPIEEEPTIPSQAPNYERSELDAQKHAAMKLEKWESQLDESPQVYEPTLSGKNLHDSTQSRAGNWKADAQNEAHAFRSAYEAHRDDAAERNASADASLEQALQDFKPEHRDGIRDSVKSRETSGSNEALHQALSEFDGLKYDKPAELPYSLEEYERCAGEPSHSTSFPKDPLSEYESIKSKQTSPAERSILNRYEERIRALESELAQYESQKKPSDLEESLSSYEQRPADDLLLRDLSEYEQLSETAEGRQRRLEQELSRHETYEKDGLPDCLRDYEHQNNAYSQTAASNNISRQGHEEPDLISKGKHVPRLGDFVSPVGYLSHQPSGKARQKPPVVAVPGSEYAIFFNPFLKTQKNKKKNGLTLTSVDGFRGQRSAGRSGKQKREEQQEEKESEQERQVKLAAINFGTKLKRHFDFARKGLRRDLTYGLMVALGLWGTVLAAGTLNDYFNNNDQLRVKPVFKNDGDEGAWAARVMENRRAAAEEALARETAAALASIQQRRQAFDEDLRTSTATAFFDDERVARGATMLALVTALLTLGRFSGR